MTTARFLVALTRSHNASCRVERSVRRSDKSRAVLYGQTWLLKTQKLALYCGVTYDVYEIFEQNEHGEWVPVEIGGVDSAETGRQRAREARKEAPKSTPKGQVRSPKTRGVKPADTLSSGSSSRSSAEVWAKVKQHGRAPLSPLQQRIAEAKERARQLIADKKARGE